MVLTPYAKEHDDEREPCIENLSPAPSSTPSIAPSKFGAAAEPGTGRILEKLSINRVPLKSIRTSAYK